jgi:hypothetical protein
MRYPNRRYGNPTAMQYYAIWYGNIPELAKSLKRSERTVKDWLSGKAKVPWWVPEIMRLQKMEHDDTVRQITGYKVLAQMGVTVPNGDVIDAGQRFHRQAPPAPPLTAVAPSGQDGDQAVGAPRLHCL